MTEQQRNSELNYLRVRGEYPFRVAELTIVIGTTSACAENTLGFVDDDGVYRNYLRVRGEYPK